MARVTGRMRALLGRRIAPPIFLLFAAAFVLAAMVAGLSLDDRRIVLLVAFDVAALVFFARVIPILKHDTATMRATARANDANRAALLAITVLLSIVILFAIGTLIADKQTLPPASIGLIVATLGLTWLFGNTVYALHYAHLYYLPHGGGDRGGLDIPHANVPDYWDFLYFSFTLGMTFQTSDVAITAGHIRRVVLGQSLAAFLFNMGILAFTINALGGL